MHLKYIKNNNALLRESKISSRIRASIEKKEEDEGIIRVTEKLG